MPIPTVHQNGSLRLMKNGAILTVFCMEALMGLYSVCSNILTVGLFGYEWVANNDGCRYVYCADYAGGFTAWVLGVSAFFYWLHDSTPHFELLSKAINGEAVFWCVQCRFLAVVTRTLNISYLKAIPLGMYFQSSRTCVDMLKKKH
jgi:hypothetical protein